MTPDPQFDLNAALMFGVTPPDVLFHYTGQNGLLGILGGRSLWATDIRCLNDELEYDYTLKLIREHLSDESFLARFHDVPALVEIWHDALGVVAKVRSYVMSFSELGDDLSQWRAYGGGGRYSIGFNSEGLLKEAMHVQQPAALFRCEYRLDKQAEWLTEALESMAQHYRKHHDESGHEYGPGVRYGAMFSGHVSNLATVFKHPSFEAEKEWRLVVKPRPGEVSSPALCFRPGPRNIVSYFNVPFDREVVRSVHVGPTPHAATGRSTVKSLLQNHGFDGVSVETSRSPFRDW